MNYPHSTTGSDFMDLWHRFLKDREFVGTAEPALDATQNELALHGKDIFVSKNTFYPIRNYSNPVKVIFLQGLQGSGKTTIAKYLVERLENATYIEQDMFGGDTAVCLGALYHLISSANGPKIIIVSRCNISITHYRRYLDMCHRLPTIVTFLAPAVFNPLYLMISLAGIFERSICSNGSNSSICSNGSNSSICSNGSNSSICSNSSNSSNSSKELESVVELSVGQSKVPTNDVISFLIGNYSSYERHEKAIQYNTFTSDVELLNGAISIYKRGSSEIVRFVKNNYKRLLGLRQPIEDICKPIIDILNVIPNKNIALPPNPAYIGAYISDSDREKLLDILKSHSPVYESNNITTHVHYTQQMYLGGKLPRQIKRTPYMPGEAIKRDICALVIRKSDGASAFRLAPLPEEEPTFHVLCNLPNGQKASTVKSFIDSNNSKIVEVIEMSYTLEMIGFWKV
jgi:hypothetical protein